MLLAVAAFFAAAKKRMPLILLGIVVAALVLAGWVWGRSPSFAAAAEMAVRVAGWTGLLCLLLALPPLRGRGKAGEREDRP